MIFFVFQVGMGYILVYHEKKNRSKIFDLSMSFGWSISRISMLGNEYFLNFPPKV